MRFELNVINLFSQKTVSSTLTTRAPDRPAPIRLGSKVDLSKGYDYKALVLASPSGANALDPLRPA